MEKKGYLKSTEESSGRSLRKVPRHGEDRNAFRGAKDKIRELFLEVVEAE